MKEKYIHCGKPYLTKEKKRGGKPEEGDLINAKPCSPNEENLVDVRCKLRFYMKEGFKRKLKK